MEKNDEIYLSVIVPAFNEQERIAESLYTIKDYLHSQKYRSEIIIVDDGSGDYTTEIVKTIDIFGEEIKEQESTTIMENIKNVGKGFSVARGILKAKGKIILFSDADLSTPISEIEKFLPHLENGSDVVIGSRRLKDSEVEKKPFYRDLMSYFFNFVVKLLAIKGIRDTQCGFKAFKSEAGHNIALLQKLYGFSFDVEQLYLANKLEYKITEVPVKWQHFEGSKVDALKDSIHMLVDILKIRFIHRKLKINKT